MSKWVGFPLAMRSISVTRWNSSSLIWARLARLTCLFGFRDSYGLLDHLSSDGFDYGTDGLFHPRRAAFFTGARLGLALATVRLAGAAFRALRSLAEAPLGSFPRFCTFDRFLRLAMIDPLFWLVLRKALMPDHKVPATYQTGYHQISA